GVVPVLPPRVGPQHELRRVLRPRHRRPDPHGAPPADKRPRRCRHDLDRGRPRAHRRRADDPVLQRDSERPRRPPRRQLPVQPPARPPPGPALDPLTGRFSGRFAPPLLRSLPFAALTPARLLDAASANPPPPLSPSRDESPASSVSKGHGGGGWTRGSR